MLNLPVRRRKNGKSRHEKQKTKNTTASSKLR